MKKIYGFAALCAAMTLASCSNNDEPNVAGGQKVESQKGYLAVTLATPGSTQTRAEDGDQVKGDEISAQGTASESEVNSAYLITFSDGRVNEIVSFTPKPWYDSDEDYIDKESSQNIVEVEVPTITVGEETKEALEKFITVLNVNPTALDIEKGNSFDDVRKKLRDYSSTTNGIIMSTSAYNKAKTGTDLVYATDAVYFKDLADAQKPENITKVFVERNVARVDYSFAEGGIETIAYEDITVDGEAQGQLKVDGLGKAMPITVTGVTIANVADKSYLVKDIDGILSWEFPNSKTAFNANVIDEYRSHWADNATIDKNQPEFVSFTNYSYNTIVGTNAGLGDITADFKKQAKYLNENTSAQPTTVLITAVVGDGSDLYRLIANGKYYSTDKNLYTAALGYLEVDQYFKKVEVEKDGKIQVQYVSLDENDLTVAAAYNTETGLNGYDGYIQFASSLQDNLYKRDESKANLEDQFVPYVGEEGLKAANKELWDATCKSERDGKELKKYRVYKWSQGKCYYFAEINPTFVGNAGIVRNHIYNLNLNQVAGLGVPVFDPSKVIIPETPDKVDPKEPDNYYVRATINILNWTYYSQDINFVTPEGE